MGYCFWGYKYNGFEAEMQGKPLFIDIFVYFRISVL